MACIGRNTAKKLHINRLITIPTAVFDFVRSPQCKYLTRRPAEQFVRSLIVEEVTEPECSWNNGNKIRRWIYLLS